MDAPELQQRCQSLSADDGEIGRALGALDEHLREWLAALHALSAGQLDAAGMWRDAKPAAAPEVASAGTPAPSAPATPAPVAPGPPPDAASVAADPVAPAAEDVAEADDDADEALLASLDPELAKAVRVKRRLAGNRRSVRELIAEVEGGRHESKERPGQAPPRKPWWRKRDE